MCDEQYCLLDDGDVDDNDVKTFLLRTANNDGLYDVT